MKFCWVPRGMRWCKRKLSPSRAPAVSAQRALRDKVIGAEIDRQVATGSELRDRLLVQTQRLEGLLDNMDRRG